MNPREKLLLIVELARGDDLERAVMRFSHMPETELGQKWGQSGHTPEELLASYRKERKEWQAAYDLAASL